jgi:hypothetical protein
MPRPRPPLILTRELVDRTIRKVADAGSPPGLIPMTDDDYAGIVEEVLSQAPPGPTAVETRV